MILLLGEDLLMSSAEIVEEMLMSLIKIWIEALVLVEKHVNFQLRVSFKAFRGLCVIR